MKTYTVRQGDHTYWINASKAEDCSLDRDAVSRLLPNLVNASDAVLRDEERLRIDLVRDGPHTWVVHHHRSPAMGIRLGHLLRNTPGWRQWEAAHRLAESGIRVGKPLALAHGWIGGEYRQAVVWPHVPGRSLATWLRDGERFPLTEGDRRDRRRIAAAAGAQFGRISAAGYIDRGYDPDRVVIDAACEQRGGQPMLADAGDLRRRRGPAQMCRHLARIRDRCREIGPIARTEAMRFVNAAREADPSLGRVPLPSMM